MLITKRRIGRILVFVIFFIIASFSYELMRIQTARTAQVLTTEWQGLSSEGATKRLVVRDSPSGLVQEATDTDGDGKADLWNVELYSENRDLATFYETSETEEWVRATFGRAGEYAEVFTGASAEDGPMYAWVELASEGAMNEKRIRYVDYNFDSTIDAIIEDVQSESRIVRVLKDRAFIAVEREPEFRNGHWSVVGLLDSDTVEYILTDQWIVAPTSE